MTEKLILMHENTPYIFFPFLKPAPTPATRGAAHGLQCVHMRDQTFFTNLPY